MPKRRLPQGVYFNDSEYAVHVAVAEWLDFKNLDWFHVPNGEYRHPATAARLKRMGVQSGVADCIILNAPPNVPGMVGTCLEIKRKRGGRLSDNQAAWVGIFRAHNWHVVVAEGFDAAVAALTLAGY